MRGGFRWVSAARAGQGVATLMVSACMVGVAQKLRAKRQAAADRKILDFTLHILSFSLSERSRTHAAIKVKETCCKAFVNR